MRRILKQWSNNKRHVFVCVCIHESILLDSQCFQLKPRCDSSTSLLRQLNHFSHDTTPPLSLPPPPALFPSLGCVSALYTHTHTHTHTHPHTLTHHTPSHTHVYLLTTYCKELLPPSPSMCVCVCVCVCVFLSLCLCVLYHDLLPPCPALHAWPYINGLIVWTVDTCATNECRYVCVSGPISQHATHVWPHTCGDSMTHTQTHKLIGSISSVWLYI